MRQIIISFLIVFIFMLYARFLLNQKVLVQTIVTTFPEDNMRENGTHFIRRNTIPNATTFKSLHKKAHHWAIH